MGARTAFISVEIALSLLKVPSGAADRGSLSLFPQAEWTEGDGGAVEAERSDQAVCSAH